MQDQLAASNFLALSKKSFAIRFDLENTEYDSIENIGTGAYGVVCSAVHRRTNEHVAIKKIPKIFEQPTVANRTYREIRILKHFKHSNIISIREILFPKDLATFQDIYIVLDLMESDLHRIIYSAQPLTNDHIRWFLYQILRGLKYIHSANVVHRDLKPSNLLVNGDCALKIGDFGMARGIHSIPDDANIKMTQYVATRWYRAPEIMLLTPTYTTGVDVWSVGCILAEMILRKPLFPGKDFRHQLQMVFETVGTPSNTYIELAHSELIKEFLIKLEPKTAKDFSELFPGSTPKAVRLVRRFLSLDPKERLSVDDALRDPYLSVHHDPDDEPVCNPPFDFSFEQEFRDLSGKKDLQSKILRDAIIKEILDYPQRKTIKDDNVKINSQLGPSDVTTDKRPQTDMPRSAVNQTEYESPQICDSDESMISKGSVGNGFLANSSFKIEISSVNDSDESQCIDAEMKSATRSDFRLFVNQQEQLDPDVRMLSAKLEEQCSISNAIETETNGDKSLIENQNAQNVLLDAKARIKIALLSKQKIEFCQREKTLFKPRKALKVQKEREEERRRKQEKALERKKKKKNNQETASPKGPVLTDEDRSLLERWQSMQKTSQNQLSLSSDSNSCSQGARALGTNSSVDNPDVQTSQMTSAYAGVMPMSSNFIQSKMNGVIPLLTQQFSTVQGTTTTSSFRSSVIPSLDNLTATNSIGRPTAASNIEFGPCLENGHSHPLVTSRLSALPPAATYSVIPPFGNAAPCAAMTPNPVTWMQSTTQQSSNVANLTTGRNQPPSYSEAIAAKRFDVQRHAEPFSQVLSLASTQQHHSTSRLKKYPIARQESEGFTLSTQQESVGISSVLPEVFRLQDSDPVYKLNHQQIVHQLDNDCDETNVGLSQSNNPLLSSILEAQTREERIEMSEGRLVAGNNSCSLGGLLQETMLQPDLIDGQFLKPHLEDLTPLQTPRGTGFGYGVGIDMSPYIVPSHGGVNEGPESAPLSATLIADWRDVTGDMDAIDFEAALQMEMGSCINLNDLMNSRNGILYQP